MASWTRTAIALLTSMPYVRKIVETALPEYTRIAAHHVQAWLVLQKQWTRAAIDRAKGMTLVAKKMVEIAAGGLHVAACHVSRLLFPLKEDAATATIEPGACLAVATKSDVIPPAKADYSQSKMDRPPPLLALSKQAPPDARQPPSQPASIAPRDLAIQPEAHIPRAQASVCTDRMLWHKSWHKAHWALPLLLVAMCVTATIL